MKFLDHLEEWLIAFLMGAATLIIFVSVVHRYGTGIDIPALQDWLLEINMGWAQELTIIMFVWMAKFGAAYGVRTGIHVGVDVLINRLSDGNRKKFIVFGLAAGAFFTFIVGSLGLTFVLENGALGMRIAVGDVGRDCGGARHRIGIDIGGKAQLLRLGAGELAVGVGQFAQHIVTNHALPQGIAAHIGHQPPLQFHHGQPRGRIDHADICPAGDLQAAAKADTF